MSPRPGVGWSGLRLEGNLHGPLAAPAVTATLAGEGLTAAGAAIGSLSATIAGTAQGETRLHASLDGLRVPGPSPALLAGGPLTLDASIRLAAAGLPARFTLTHPLLSAVGTADASRGRMRLTVPDLAPFAAAGGLDLRGHGELDLGATRADAAVDLTASGAVAITGGAPPIQGLVGNTGTLALAATALDGKLTLHRLSLSGAGFDAAANGQFAAHLVDLDWTLALPNLSAIQPGLVGTVAAGGHAAGTPTAFSVSGDLTGNLAAKGERLERIDAHLTMDGLPGAPAGRLTAGGTLLDAPLNIAIGAERRRDAVHIGIDRASWKSLTGGGTLDFAAGEVFPAGNLTLSVSRLADLTPFLGRPVAGTLTASLDTSPAAARISAEITGGAVPGAGAVARTALDATITDPAGHPFVDGGLTFDGVTAGGVRASGRLSGQGPLNGLRLALVVDQAALRGMPARIESSGTLDVAGNTLSLATLRGTWGRETVRLLAPARIGFAQGVAVDKLRLGPRQGELAIAGRWAAARPRPEAATRSA